MRNNGQMSSFHLNTPSCSTSPTACHTACSVTQETKRVKYGSGPMMPLYSCAEYVIPSATPKPTPDAMPHRHAPCQVGRSRRRMYQSNGNALHNSSHNPTMHV